MAKFTPWDNPMGTDGFEFIEFAAPDPAALGALFETMGFKAEARHRHEKGEKTDLFKLMEKHEKPRLTSGIWERALDHGDDLAEALIDRAIEALGTGIASAVNLIDPEAVIVGGGLGVRFGERYMEPLLEEMGHHLFLDENPPAVRVASLGDLGGAIGASLLVSR